MVMKIPVKKKTEIKLRKSDCDCDLPEFYDRVMSKYADRVVFGQQYNPSHIKVTMDVHDALKKYFLKNNPERKDIEFEYQFMNWGPGILDENYDLTGEYKAVISPGFTKTD